MLILARSRHTDERKTMMITTCISPLLKTCLQFIGVWPDAPYGSAYRLVYISSMLSMQYFQYLYVFTHLRINELTNLADNLPVTLDYTLTISKLIVLWTNHRMIRQILSAMDYDWRTCVNQQLYAMTIKADVSHLCTKVMLASYTIVGMIYLLGNYAVNSLADERNDTLRHFPLKVHFPFDAEHTPTFEVLFIIMFLQGIINGMTIATLNALIFALVLHASGQIDIICQEFRVIAEKTPLCGTSASTLGMLIERHKRIITFSDSIDNLLSFIAFVQIIGNTLVISSLAFLVIVSLHSDGNGMVTLVKAALAYFGISAEVFIFCFAGEYLSLKSRSIAEAAYDSLWYNLPSNQVKVISFMIMRSQRQMTITAGRIVDLSLEVFTSIMKTSASYTSVLYAMY